jgi:hypothetical protein
MLGILSVINNWAETPKRRLGFHQPKKILAFLELLATSIALHSVCQIVATRNSDDTETIKRKAPSGYRQHRSCRRLPRRTRRGAARSSHDGTHQSQGIMKEGSSGPRGARLRASEASPKSLTPKTARAIFGPERSKMAEFKVVEILRMEGSVMTGTTLGENMPRREANFL